MRVVLAALALLVPSICSAESALAKRCHKGDGAACFEFARALNDLGEKGTAIHYVTKSCELGYSNGCIVISRYRHSEEARINRIEEIKRLMSAYSMMRQNRQTIDYATPARNLADFFNKSSEEQERRRLERNRQISNTILCKTKFSNPYSGYVTETECN